MPFDIPLLRNNKTHTTGPSVSKGIVSPWSQIFLNDPVKTKENPDTQKDFVNPMGGVAFLTCKANDPTHTGAWYEDHNYFGAQGLLDLPLAVKTAK
jgi:hypothetical protein